MNKKYLVSSILLVAVIVSASVVGWTMFSSDANKDWTCYNYTVSQGSCEINENNCGSWSNGKRVCNGTVVNTYNRGASYRCGTSNSESRKTYSVNAACSLEQFDSNAPEIVEGGVE